MFKSRKNFKYVVCVVLAMSFCCACGSNEDVPKDSEQSENKEDLGNDNFPAITYKDEIKYANEEGILDTNTPVLYKDISHQISNVEIGKEMGNRKNVDTSLFLDSIDEEGNLLGEESYVWITLKLKNMSEEEKEILVNYPMVWIGSDNIVTEAPGEGIYIYPDQKNEKPWEEFHCTLKSGEEKEVEVGYFLDEIDTEKKLYLCIGHSGSVLDSPENHFLYLGEFTDEK